ncbi:zinc dependent phospholipase C family protein [Pyxidicoccus trucidator]|uniref:zinc dependent phospholipase C family protein n=1 Tax=Pyxidicoccus trucidator TaxID=2709662 RepID=UPI0013DCB523|nr:zinc dependent phospholipase C family protein [Pyxidicoccus trucidator]
MPAVLTHKTIMLLTRERLARIRDGLRNKINLGVDVTDLEYRVWHLADQAHRLMSEHAGPEAPAISYPTDGSIYLSPLGKGVSRFSVMGSMGPDIPAFSSFFSRGQAWVFDTVHKGNPDSHRELVVAKTHTFVLELWQAVGRAVADGSATADEAKKLAGYMLGHLCHVAADVISHPFINDLEWHNGYRTRHKFSHSGGEGSIDARVAHQVLLRESTREGQDWDVWWPTLDEVPRAFFPAYVDALERVYGAQSARPVGFGPFETAFREHQPPSLTVDFLRDGYKFYRTGVVGMGYGWGYWRWFFFLTPMMLPALAIAPLLVALPNSRQFIERELEDVDERGWFELLMMPAALGIIPMGFYGIWLAAITTKGVGALHGVGLAGFGVSFILALVFLITLGDAPDTWTRWLALLAPVGLFGAAMATKGMVDLASGDKPRMALDLIYALPFLFALVALLLVLLLVSTFRELGEGGGTGGFIALVCVMSIGVLLGWILLPWTVRDARIPEHPESFPADRKHFVRLFDDSTLFTLPGGDAATLDKLHYPSGRRPLLKLWWEGPGNLFIRSEQSRLDFSFTGTGEPARTLEAPIVPMSVREYAQYLNQTFEGPGGERNKLKATLVFPEDADLDYELPPGATFSEELGAGDESEEGLPESVTAWYPVGTTADDTKYVLHHADKAYQAVRFGTRGAVGSPAPEDDAVGGPGKIVSSGTSVHGAGFDYFFEPGDQLESEGQLRIVTDIVSDTLLHVDRAFDPPISAKRYSRVGPREEPRDGYTYVTDPRMPPGVLGGESIMDLAADLGALLCMGMTPHLLTEAERLIPELAGRAPRGGGAAVAPGVSKVYQVFRNWSLDRRRVNEWRMLVMGGARSEKGGNVASYDAAMPQPRDPDWVAPRSADGEPFSNAQGWVPVLRQWLERTTVRACAAPARPGEPTTEELGKALAYLLDLPAPLTL